MFSLGALRRQVILDLDLAYLLTICFFLRRKLRLAVLILGVFKIFIGLFGSEHH